MVQSTTNSCNAPAETARLLPTHPPLLLHPEHAPSPPPLPQAWRQQLVALQPLVQLEDAVLLGAVELVRELMASRPELVPTLHASVPHLYTYLAAGMLLWAQHPPAGAVSYGTCEEGPDRAAAVPWQGSAASAMAPVHLQSLPAARPRP